MDSFSGNDTNLKSYNVANLRLSTAYRTNIRDPDTNCIIQLNQSRLLTNVVKVDVNYVNICNVFHNVASYNNKFELQIFDINVGPPVTFYSMEIPVGYYTATELGVVIQAALRGIDTRLQLLTYVYDTTLERYIAASNNGTYYCRLVPFPNNQNQFGNNFLWLIGAEPRVYQQITQFPTPTPYPTNLTGATSVYLLSRKLATTKSVFEQLDNQGRVSSIIGNEVMSIGVNSAYGVYQTYYDQGSDRGVNTFSTGFILDEVDIKFVDEWNNVLESDRPLNPIQIGIKLYYI
jgi:hypothetical protein